MSDFKHTSLQEELEVRVIALLTGELGETEADELEKILEINQELSAFRDRMAGLMGELHSGSDELAPAESEAPRRLSEERRARIFGDASLLEPKSKSRRPRFKLTVWAIAASFAMLFVVGLLSTIQFTQSVLHEAHVFEAMPVVASSSLDDRAFTITMPQRNRSTSGSRSDVSAAITSEDYSKFAASDVADEVVQLHAPPAPSIAVEEPPGLDVPAREIAVNADSSAAYGRSGGGFGGGLAGVREIRDRHTNASGQNYARAGETIPVEIPKELIEGTPQPIRVPGLEPALTQAPRMVVAGAAKELSQLPAAKPEAQSMSGTRETELKLSDFDFSAPTARHAPRENEAPAQRKSGITQSPKDGQSDFLGEDAVDDLIISNRGDPLPGRKDEVMSREGMLRQVEHSWELSPIVASSANSSNLKDKTKDIVIPPDKSRAQKVRPTPKPEQLAAEAPVSTFSLNISDVSFKLAQAALQNSRVPPSGQIRTEEFVNSFDYGDPAPRPDEAISLHWEMAQHPFEHDRQVVRFSLQTQAHGRAAGQPLNLTLLVDNSGSMQRPDRQAILRNSLQTLEQKLTDKDRLNVLLFARQPRLLAEAQTRESQQAAVQNALAFRPEGGTNLEAGLQAAYETARRNYLPAGGNRVILLTDGAANLGNVKAGELADYVNDQRRQGIALDAYGIGWDDYNDALLEEITRNGDGRYAFLNSAEDASGDFAEKLAGTLRVAAANVKVQIEWNPERVQRYRQIGYDLHQLQQEDFRDNTVDAAEIGEAESGTALYVLQIDEAPEVAGGLGTLHVRYLDPASGRYRERRWPLPMPRQVPAAAAASPSMRLAMSSAFFGERLADSPYAGGYDFRDLYAMTAGLPEAFPTQPRVAELQSMLLQASEVYGDK